MTSAEISPAVAVGEETAVMRRLAALEARLDQQEAKEAARAVLHRYGAACDAGDAAAVAAVFTPDGVLDTTRARFEGAEAIEGFFRGALQPPIRHFITNSTLTSTAPGVVEAESLFLALGADGGRSVIVWGAYSDTVVVDGGGALLSRKTITIDKRTDLEHGWAEGGSG